jgi:alpha-galactosidase
MLDYYDEDCFLQRNGKRLAVMGRHFLDFRAKKVVEYMTETIRRMVEDYGAEYIKFDYNQDCGVGTDYLAFCTGEGLEQSAKAYLKWVDDIRTRFSSVLWGIISLKARWHLIMQIKENERGKDLRIINLCETEILDNILV